MAQEKPPVRRQDDYTFRAISAEEAYRDAVRYWLRWRAGLAKVKPFTPGFPDLEELYDPDQGGAPPPAPFTATGGAWKPGRPLGATPPS